jgi:phospholipase C
MSQPSLDSITTVVVVMMENRSFDHVLGYLTLRKGWENVDGVKPDDPAWIDSTTNTYNGRRYTPFEQKNVVGKMARDLTRWSSQPRTVRMPSFHCFMSASCNSPGG